MKGWLKPKSAARYCDVGERTLRSWIKDYDLRHSKIKGITLIKISWLDQFLSQHEVSQIDEVKTIVDEVVKDLI